jgi:hypothetical protein
MAVKLNSLRADMRRQNDGDWVEIPELPGVAFKVRGINYGPYQAENSTLLMAYRRRYEARGLPVPNEISNRDIARIYAKHLLLDWRGFLDDNEAELPYSREVAEEMLGAPGDFFRHVLFAVTQVSNTEAEIVEDTAKNSPRPSAGSSEAA